MKILLLLLVFALFVPWANVSHKEILPTTEFPSQIITEDKRDEKIAAPQKEKIIPPPVKPTPQPTPPVTVVEKPKPTPPAPVVTVSFATTIENEILRLTNQERVNAGYTLLAQESRLRPIAERHSADMLKNDYFSHTNKEGCSSSCRATNAGYTWRAIGENIYMMSGFDLSAEATAAAIVEGWMNSPGHRANILGDFTVTDVGVAVSGEDVYATALYATPR